MQSNIILLDILEKIFLWIDQADTWLFLQINSHWTNGWLDNIMPWWRDSNTWIPLYLFMILFLTLNFKNKAWLWILFAVINVVLTDQTSSHLIKILFSVQDLVLMNFCSFMCVYYWIIVQVATVLLHHMHATISGLQFLFSSH